MVCFIGIIQSRICAPVVFLSLSVTLIVALTTATVTCYETGIYRDCQVYAGAHKHTQEHTDVNDNNVREMFCKVSPGGLGSAGEMLMIN